MKLYIAEKPSLGRAIADVLPKPHRRHNGYISTGSGDIVSWCIGHLLEQAEPHKYNSEFKSWRMQHLPIVPEQWKLVPKPKTKEQLGVLKKLVAEADNLVHAGDPDREGQLLVDQLFAYLKVTKVKRDRIERVLINDLNPQAVKRALSAAQRNVEFVSLSSSALARSRADWLYGINMTRAYTIQGRKTGYDGVLSVGRVQTPVLGLVVRRCEEIENFVSKPFYEVIAHLLTEQKASFTATWQPSEACEPYMDDEGRVLHKALAESVVKRIDNQPAVVTQVTSKLKKLRQPLLYNLSALQIDASKRYGLSAQQTLSVCQGLYEKHKLITYPRSDCRYLPVEQYQQRSDILAAIRSNDSRFAAVLDNADTTIKSPAWNDKKVGAHHAIIPTLKTLNPSVLSEHERKIYALVSRQYIAQFYPVHEYNDTRVEINIAGGVFVASWKQVKVQGWKVLFDKPQKNQPDAPAKPPVQLVKGQALHCTRGELIEKNTTPPAYFTDATLLAAMTGIARYVKEDSVRKILRETDGLGTEATRAGIIELLIKRGLMCRQGKQIHDTPAGRALVATLPAEAVVPDMTAQWESMLDRISRADITYRDFMQPLETQLQRLIDQSATCEITALKGVKAVGGKARGGKKTAKRRARKKTARKKAVSKKR